MKDLSSYINEKDYEGAKLFLKSLDTNNDILGELVGSFHIHGMLPLFLLMDIAYEEDNSYWYSIVGYYLSFSFHFMDGGELSGLYFFKKAHLKDEKKISIMQSILGYGSPPEIVLDVEDGIMYAKKILELDKNNEKALKYLSKHTK